MGMCCSLKTPCPAFPHFWCCNSWGAPQSFVPCLLHPKGKSARAVCQVQRERAQFLRHYPEGEGRGMTTLHTRTPCLLPSLKRSRMSLNALTIIFSTLGGCSEHRNTSCSPARGRHSICGGSGGRTPFLALLPPEMGAGSDLYSAMQSAARKFSLVTNFSLATKNE